MRRTILFALPLLFVGVGSLAAEPYAFDTNHTRIAYSIDHMGLSQMHGAFRQFTGELQLDVKDLAASSVKIHIDVASIDTGVEKLDEHLRTADFFEVAKYPEMQFVSTAVKPIDTGHFSVVGDLTLHGVTHPVTLDVRMRTLDMHPMRKVPAAGFVAKAVIYRADFGIKIYPGMLGDTVAIRIDSEAYQNLPKPAAEAAPAQQQ